ncbi:hypothetical protein GGI35DRAFT_465581 [Trichoderma velutinum]
MSEQPKTRQKFRSSCTNCATAKVKCTTTRPECARCVERGLECLYAPSNRYGRPPASVGSQKATSFRSPQVDGCDLAMNDYASDGGTWDFNAWMPASACNLTAQNIHYEIDAFSAAVYYKEWNLEDIPQLVATSSHGSNSMNTNSLKNSFSGASEGFQEAIHSCLAQATAILVDIRHDSSSTDLTWAAANVDAKTIVGDVIFANRRATGQVSRIMECACLAADYQISVIVSLICFHMIDRYGKAVAAAKATLGNTGGNNHVVASVQILLDELRRITPLIGILRMQTGGSPGSVKTTGNPVSGFDQLQRDLEHHLFSVLSEAESFLHEASQ